MYGGLTSTVVLISRNTVDCLSSIWLHTYDYLSFFFELQYRRVDSGSRGTAPAQLLTQKLGLRDYYRAISGPGGRTRWPYDRIHNYAS
jgi:hypothetical protein